MRATSSEYTVKSLPQDFPEGGKVEFQVKAYIATGHRHFNSNFGYWTWEESNWSDTQTITIGDNANPLLSQSSTSAPSKSNAESSTFLGLEWGELVIVALLAAVVVLLGLVVVYLRKRSLK